jgi:Major Facilitator Superfamily.
VVAVYILYNLVYALAAFPLGILADRIGMRSVFVGGIWVFAGVYAGMALTQRISVVIALFFFYGIYSAATESVAKAWISNLSAREYTATAIGTYTAFQSLAAIFASGLAGLLWQLAGSAWALGVSAVVAAGVGIYLAQLERKLFSSAN